MVARIKQVLAAYGLDRPVWLNESGVPVWDDYPGPTWTASSPAGAAVSRDDAGAGALRDREHGAGVGGRRGCSLHLPALRRLRQPARRARISRPTAGRRATLTACSATTAGRPASPRVRSRTRPRPAAASYYRMAQIFGSRQFSGGTRVNLGGKGSVVAFDLSPAQGVAQFGPVTEGGSGSSSQRARLRDLEYAARIGWSWKSPPAASSGAALRYDAATITCSRRRTAYTRSGCPPSPPSDYPQLTSSEFSTHQRRAATS